MTCGSLKHTPKFPAPRICAGLLSLMINHTALGLMSKLREGGLCEAGTFPRN